MKFGMNLLLWTDDLKDEMFPVLQRLKGMGYDGVEVPIFDLNVSKYAAWGKRLDDLGLERTAVTARVAKDNPMSSDKAVRTLGVENNKRAIECCQALGVQMLVGPYHSALGEFSGQGPTVDEWKWAVESMRQVAPYAADAGVMLGVESLNRFECYLINCVADTVRFVRDVNHPSCRMMFDTLHANIEEKNIPQAIRASQEYMVHVHISENDRSTPGQGNVRWAENFDTLKEINYNGWLVVESFGLALPALVAATKIWRRMYQSEEQLASDALAFMKREWSSRL
jgi:D-psicose/D-tagatose/L-ribulose 3-epimerase